MNSQFTTRPLTDAQARKYLKFLESIKLTSEVQDFESKKIITIKDIEYHELEKIRDFERREGF